MKIPEWLPWKDDSETIGTRRGAKGTQFTKEITMTSETDREIAALWRAVNEILKRLKELEKEK